ncbi:MAG: C10 family peptidase [Ignavibacteriales bacterium]|nr:C10 family peptidase [Ignavibacteriales bacterium]
MRIANEFCETTINRQSKTKSERVYQPKTYKPGTLQTQSTEEFSVSTLNNYSVNNEQILNVVELEPNGFIVMSNNKSIEPIIAYSINSDFQYDTIEANILLTLLINDLMNRVRQKIIDDEWSRATYQSDNYIYRQWPSEGTTSTGGWVETTWDQFDPVNRQAPFLSECSHRAPIGCTPLAIAQIVNLHKYLGPWDFNFESYGLAYFSPAYSVPTFEEQEILYEELRSKYQNDIPINDDDIATLGRVSAMAAFTMFGCSGSRTWEEHAARAFKRSENSLGYSNVVWNDFHNRASFGQIEEWDSTTIEGLVEQGYPDNFYFYNDLIENMINGLPAIINIETGDLDHSVVCDGYNVDGFFHLNYGWGTISPYSISDMWYKIPYILPDEHLFSSIAYDIMPYPIPDFINEEMIFLYSKEPMNTKSVLIRSKDEELTVSQVYSTFGYCEFSSDSINFSPSLSNISLGSNDSVVLYIRSVDFENDRLIDNMIVDFGQQSELIEIAIHKIPDTATIINQKEISGIWTKEHSPYYLLSDCGVKDNDSLRISEGVTIISHNTELIVPNSSVIKASGTRESPIVFKPLDSTYIFPKSGWLGITFEMGNRNDNLFEFCNFYDAKRTLKEEYKQYGTIAAYYADVSFNNCQFINCWTPIMATGSTLTISNCLFKDNLYGYLATDILAGSFSNIDIYNSIFINSHDFQYNNRFSPPYEWNQYSEETSELLRKSFHIGASKVNFYNSNIFGSDLTDIKGTNVEVKIVNSCLINSRIQSLNNCMLEIRNSYSNLSLDEIISPDLVDKCVSFLNEGNIFNGDSINLYEVPNECIDAGYSWLSDSSQTDFLGKARIWDGNNDGIANIDIGAFEYNSVYKRYYKTCDNVVLEINGRIIENSGLYIDSLIGYDGRDSTIYSYLNIMPSFDTTNYISICEGESYFAQGAYQTEPGTYYDTLVTTWGCDSVIVTNLSINQTYENEVDVFICKGESYFAQGDYQTEPGIYFDTMTTVLGCDSIIRTSISNFPVNVVNLGNDTSICQNDTIILNAGEGFVEYNWNTGENSENILVTHFEIGTYNYQVSVLDKNRCMSSDSILIEVFNPNTFTKILDNRNISIFPNPTQNKIFIRSNKTINFQIFISIYDGSGKEIYNLRFEKMIQDINYEIDTRLIKAGIYILKINNSDEIIIEKIIKK